MKTCTSCGYPTVDYRIRQADPTVRAHTRSYTGRGLCTTCYHRARKDGTIFDFERQVWPADELLDEWVLLRDDGYSVRQAAERIGVTWVALDRATARAKRAGDPRGERRAFGRTA